MLRACTCVSANTANRSRQDVSIVMVNRKNLCQREACTLLLGGLILHISMTTAHCTKPALMTRTAVDLRSRAWWRRNISFETAAATRVLVCPNLVRPSKVDGIATYI